ncbi:metal ABC transporter ATP-binding protein [Aquibacillus koreensis]|uniref:Metal ABC transporter ATP-binding protein n=1 Tax=Aquibacillus koreensis TaxID=279446 RepID=A0A9X3WLD7_9BACI|nr:metal ABC transporter ATP-binding protein [Aquibacillus koreensis]MCT2535940.1 metal ABC transporter ATP-binding protein [Aquibacillus koreensis]MDC3420396.1 metal ABC transporter ATP-binding protein [Aquibacillus koreensis]
MSNPIVEMKDVSYTYENKHALDHINFTIQKQAFIGLVGPNGGGKTTLIKLLLGINKLQSGSIHLFGEPIHKFKQWNKIGFVSQKANAFNRGFPATVQEVVSMGLTPKVGYLKFFTKAHKQKIEEAVEQVGMSEYLHENIGDLSGGQQQRVFIARALVSNPALLILDEPTVGVDAENVKKFYDLLHHLNEKQQITLLLVTHDIGTMTHHATDIVCLNKALHFHGNPTEFTRLSEHDLSHFYGHPLNVVTHNH